MLERVFPTPVPADFTLKRLFLTPCKAVVRYALE